MKALVDAIVFSLRKENRRLYAVRLYAVISNHGMELGGWQHTSDSQLSEMLIKRMPRLDCILDLR